MSSGDGTHYDVLGVKRSASATEIRRAYLQLARTYHPDANARRSTSARQDADRRMRRINAAWAVLGDAERRRRYDDELARADARPTVRRARAPNAPSPDFVPFDPGDDEIDPRLLDDTPVAGTEMPRWLQLLGPSLLLASVASFCVGLVTSFPPFLSFAVLAFVGALLSFVVSPMIAVRHSARAERR